jgi:HSP20 family protein
MMALSRFNLPASPFAVLRSEIDNLFDGFLRGDPRNVLSGVRPYPALNVWEDHEALYAEAEIPGLRMEDVEVLVNGNELSVKGRRPATEESDSVYHRRERGAGEFARFMTLPTEVDADRVEATLKDGVLLIKLPKAERARARKITVQTA